MFSQRIAALLLAGLFAVCVSYGGAQMPPAKTVVNLGGLGLAGATDVSSIGSPLAIDRLMNESSTDNPTMNNSTMNNSSLNSSSSNTLLNASSINEAPPVQPIDLSRYSQDRRNKNLAGYRNIMYPFAEARGSTVSTASSGGCGCG